jgi:hypothetical protein
LLCRNIEESLAEVRKELCNLADRSIVEQLLRQEQEYQKYLAARPRRPSLRLEPTETDQAIQTCQDCISRGDLDTAFLTVLRYIDFFSNSKADSGELSERATREYVEARFDQLEVTMRRQLAATYYPVQREIEAELQLLSAEFAAFEDSVTARMQASAEELDRIEEGIAQLSGRCTAQEKGRLPSKRLKLRHDGIAEPVRLEQKSEPSAKMLMPAVLIKSAARGEMRSIIPPTRPSLLEWEG